MEKEKSYVSGIIGGIIGGFIASIPWVVIYAMAVWSYQF